MSEQVSVNRAIAVALGYSVKPYVWTNDDDEAVQGYAVLDAKGNNYSYISYCHIPRTEAEAFKQSTMRDYLHSLDAVAAELAGKNVRLELDFENGMATLTDFTGPNYAPTEYHGASVGKVDAVEAAARALLLYAEAQRGEGV